MPKCKYCGTRLSKFDSDICPVCGGKNPLEGVSSETIEITSQFTFNDELKKEAKYNGHKKITTFLLFALIGWTGAPLFYLKHTVPALFYLFISLCAVGALGTVLFFFTDLRFYSYLLVGGIDYIFNIIVGVYLVNKTDFKDGNGEFLH